MCGSRAEALRPSWLVGLFPLTVTVTTRGNRNYNTPLFRPPLRTVTGWGNDPNAWHDGYRVSTLPEPLVPNLIGPKQSFYDERHLGYYYRFERIALINAPNIVNTTAVMVPTPCFLPLLPKIKVPIQYPK